MAPNSHCHYCGGPLTSKFIEGRRRRYCPSCARPIYENPIPATCLVVVNGHDDVLLVKRNVAPKKGEWCLPGGFIELGEAPEQGALRELAEETGLSGQAPSLLGVRTTPSTQYHSVLMVGYLIRHFRGALIPGDDAADARWFSRASLPPIAFDSHRHFIKLCLKGWSDPHVNPDPI
jgi:ADP-ribose pyrophosphatase YjhB (NUDIX family)